MFKQRAANFFYFQFERIKQMHLFYIQWKLIPSYSASKRYRFFSFACFHPRYKEISGCICQASTNIPVRAFCEQIRKIARCVASYCIIRHCSCFNFDHITGSDPFMVLNQNGSRCIRDNPCSLLTIPSTREKDLACNGGGWPLESSVHSKRGLNHQDLPLCGLSLCSFVSGSLTEIGFKLYGPDVHKQFIMTNYIRPWHRTVTRPHTAPWLTLTGL